MTKGGHCRRSSLTARLTSGFTLVELLVVIGIIAVLISVLLPTLASARRSGISVKCKASLHQIGDAFKMYAVDNRGWWPIVKFSAEPNRIAQGDLETRTWQDYLFPYLHKGMALPTGMFRSDSGSGKDELRSDLAKLRGISPLWGCQAFRGDDYFDANDPIAHYSTGYGMQYYPAAPYKNSDGTINYNSPSVVVPGINELCLYDANGTVKGRWWKGVEWNKNGANRLVVADANQLWIYTSSGGHSKSDFKCEPFWSNAGTHIRIDGMRHYAKPTSLRTPPPMTPQHKALLNSPGINALFADGHVDGITPFGAFNATMGGGYDILVP